MSSQNASPPKISGAPAGATEGRQHGDLNRANQPLRTLVSAAHGGRITPAGRTRHRNARFASSCKSYAIEERLESGICPHERVLGENSHEERCVFFQISGALEPDEALVAIPCLRISNREGAGDPERERAFGIEAPLELLDPHALKSGHSALFIRFPQCGEDAIAYAGVRSELECAGKRLVRWTRSSRRR